MRLRASRVTVVGLGGTGGAAATALVASGVGRLHCVDDDVVELSNLNRQVLYTESDLGRPKVDAALARLRQLNTDISVTGERSSVGSSADLAVLADDCDVLVLAADTPAEIRSWTNRACLTTGTPWVESGYHGPLVSLGVYVPGEGACYECHRLADAERRNGLLPRPDDVDRLVAQAAPAAVSAPSAGMCGQLAAHAVLALLTGIPPLPPGRIHRLNLSALDAAEAVDSTRRPDCPACGDVGA